MRPSALPKLVVAHQKLDNMAADKYGDYSDSPQSIVSAHSQESSASENYSPLTQTFSFQDQTRFYDSSSSLGTTPPKCNQFMDSPRASRTTLDDLVEVPDEREDGFDFCDLARTTSDCRCEHICHSKSSQRFKLTADLGESPICIRQCASASALERPSLDYSLADGFNSDGEAPLRMSKVRPSSGNLGVGKIATRIGSRMPSLSRRLREKGSPASPTHQPSVRSAPTSRVPSRAPSFRLPSLNKSFVNNLENTNFTPAASPDTFGGATVAEQPREQVRPIDIPVQNPLDKEPIDRKALASTPLLPTSMMERCGSEHDGIQSPLQSPTVADSPHFAPSSPNSLFVLSTETSPSLLSKPSIASFSAMQSSQVLSSPEVSQGDFSRMEDRWAAELGHANFVIYPGPYVPEMCDSAACKRLVEDWEDARKQFINQATRTSEHYGPTSHIYKMTEQKWAEIDRLWRKNHETAVERAKKLEKNRGESPHDSRLPEREYQPLAEPAPLVKLPSLNDPNNVGKFPKLDETDIVGPMVQYAQITTQASKRTAFLKFFKDMRFPANTLGRTASGIRR